jgi:hypothetical protein
VNKFGLVFSGVLGLAVWVCGYEGPAAQDTPANGVPAHMVVTVEPHHGSDAPPVNREDVIV